jgi:transcription termination/antitermination protein NusG
VSRSFPDRRECREGGEALPESTANRGWYALWTHSHCEQIVHDQLAHKGFDAFLPTVNQWSRRRGVRRLVRAPMFPGYLFLRHAMDKASYIQVQSVKGLVRVLGERWDRLEMIPAEEIEGIEKAASAQQPVLPFPYLKEGQRARVAGGPLKGVEGILVEARSRQGLLVLSVHLLQRSVAVVVDSTDVVPAA